MRGELFLTLLEELFLAVGPRLSSRNERNRGAIKHVRRRGRRWANLGRKQVPRPPVRKFITSEETAWDQGTKSGPLVTKGRRITKQAPRTCMKVGEPQVARPREGPQCSRSGQRQTFTWENIY